MKVLLFVCFVSSNSLCFSQKVIVACITEQYKTKIDEPLGTDNCGKEFDVALVRGRAYMQPVVMEATMCNQRRWGDGKLNLLKSALFIDFIDDSKVDAAARQIMRKVIGARNLGRERA